MPNRTSGVISVIIRSILRLLAVALLGLALGAPLTGTAQAQPFPDRIELPNGFQPEGITIGPRATAYLGSLASGDIYAVNLRTGNGSVISEGPGSPSAGLKIDNRGHLFVAGGPSGAGRVIDVRTGDIQTYQFTTAPTFINDVVLTRDYAWFTDSQQAQLYGVPLGRGGKPGRQTDVVTLPLTGDWQQVPNVFNANGIAQTPNRKALLVVNSTTGVLFRVDPRTGVATRVDLGGASLTNGDGLLVRGKTLYVVRNQLNEVAVIKLNASGTRGRLVDTLKSPDFDVPTTVAAFGNSLYLPNARFSTTPTPDTPYWITRIDRR
jgi:sugar lactone lactonase YvrE